MTQYNATGKKTFTSGAALPQHRRVKLAAGVLQLAGAGPDDVAAEQGTVETAVFAASKPTTVLQPNFPGTRLMVAAGAFSVGPVFPAADGKIDDVASGPSCGYALEAATGAGDIVEVLYGYKSYVEQLAVIEIEDLAAGGDIAARCAFVHPRACVLLSATVLSKAAPAGVDDSNTSVIAITDEAGNSIVSKTYNTATTFPSSADDDLGTLSATHKILDALEIVKIAVTNGATANLPLFSIALRYVVAM